MARLTNQLRDLITERVGRFNTDVLVGWEAGQQGKQRIGGRLFDRCPPEHFLGLRCDDWRSGYRAGLAEKEHEASRREVTFAGVNQDGGVVVRRKGWGVPRGQVVTQMERRGCYGLVLVQYWNGSTVVRTVHCQI
jgi:hypothetical protein